MDVQLIASSVLDLPSSQRVDAIVHDGTTDLRTWPGPGPDRDLQEHYGDELSSVLDRERGRLEGGQLGIGQMLRLHRGKLHCDFLLWVATRPPEVRGIQAQAPGAEMIENAVKDGLAFASERHVARVALGALGAGPGALDDVERLVIIGKAANAYYDECFRAGRPAGIEDVLVCHPHSSKISAARRQLGRSVTLVQEPPKLPEPAPKKKTPARSSGPRTRAKSRVQAPTLSAAEAAAARTSSGPYDRAKKYEPGQYMVHAKFGAGRVEEVTREGFIIVVFEGGDLKRLLHARP